MAEPRVDMRHPEENSKCDKLCLSCLPCSILASLADLDADGGRPPYVLQRGRSSSSRSSIHRLAAQHVLQIEVSQAGFFVCFSWRHGLGSLLRNKHGVVECPNR